MSNIIYRAAREDELPATLDLFLEAVTELYMRNNLTQPLPPRVGVEVVYRHIYKTGIFRVAEMDKQLVGICHAIMRDELWFLSGFWARPGVQARGIGGRLLREVWQEGADAGAKKFFVWSSMDQTAIASYLKIGMLPGYQLLTFTGQPTALRDLPYAPQRYTVEPLSLEVACGIDREVRETRREIDHRFWLTELNFKGRQVRRRGRLVGYYYFEGETFGPVAWMERDAAEAVLTLACREASAQTETLSLRVPGINHDAIRFAPIPRIGAGALLKFSRRCSATSAVSPPPLLEHHETKQAARLS
ncbi:MAG: GNAT family N-acetyltransferase [Acidobacteria bacterium]|nr:GNAT family N-acetyltransferase [Acidobacteriota bacterium]